MGCVFSQIVTGKVLFQADTQIEMLFKIFERLGTPSPYIAPYLGELELFKVTGCVNRTELGGDISQVLPLAVLVRSGVYIKNRICGGRSDQTDAVSGPWAAADRRRSSEPYIFLMN